jgi:hypothetical protein
MSPLYIKRGASGHMLLSEADTKGVIGAKGAVLV